MVKSLIVASVAGAVLVPLTLSRPAPPEPEPDPPMEFTATAYCLDGVTKSGTTVQHGIVAADPHVLPLGSIIVIEEPVDHAGIYTVLDTGGAIKGERLDIYLPGCADATEFGRQPVQLRVLRHGWAP